MSVIDEDQIPSDTVEVTYTPEETALISLDFRRYMTDASGWDKAKIEQLLDKLSEENTREYLGKEDDEKTFDPQYLARDSRWEELRCMEAMMGLSYSTSVAGSKDLRESWEKELLRALDKATEAEGESEFAEDENRPSSLQIHQGWARMLLLSVFEAACDERKKNKTVQSTSEM